MSAPQDETFPIQPPVKPMLAKLRASVPEDGEYLYEPKWDGFRALIFSGEGSIFMQSRDSRPLDRYFPELRNALLEGLPDRCVVDGEIVIITGAGLDFDRLQLRLHPAKSRVDRLAAEMPASFVAFDVLAFDGTDVTAEPQRKRRAALERMLGSVAPPLYLTPVTRDP